MTNPTPLRRFRRICTECGVEHMANVKHADFCGTECRRAFNNRRMVRGAELYDLFMALRYDRPLAKALGVWRLMCRMAMGWRAEDVEVRAGRRSWRPAGQVIERHTYLAATAVFTPSKRAA